MVTKNCKCECKCASMCQYHPVCFMKDRSSLWEERLYCLLVYLSIPALKPCESLPTGPLSSWRFAGSLDSSLNLFKNPLHPHPPLVFFSESMKPLTKADQADRWLPSPLITPPKGPHLHLLGHANPRIPWFASASNAPAQRGPPFKSRDPPALAPGAIVKVTELQPWYMTYMIYEICMWYHMPEKNVQPKTVASKIWRSWRWPLTLGNAGRPSMVLLPTFLPFFNDSAFILWNPFLGCPPPGMKRT